MTVYIVKHRETIVAVMSTSEKAHARERSLVQMNRDKYYYVTQHVVDEEIEPRTAAGSLD